MGSRNQARRMPATRTAGTGAARMGPGSLALAFLHTIDASAQAKEARATPGRAGNRARDGGEAGVGRLAPHVAARTDGDRVPLAPVFAHEHGAGLEAPWAV